VHCKVGSKNLPKKGKRYVKILGARKRDIKGIPYWGSTNIMRHRTKFRGQSDPTPGICWSLWSSTQSDK